MRPHILQAALLIVAAFADYTGRGPTKARTSIRDDVVLCLLQHTLTRGEKSLVR